MPWSKKSFDPEGLLSAIEKAGNRLPDPALLFLLLAVAVGLLSWPLSFMDFDALHPVTGEAVKANNQLTGSALALFLSSMVTTFVTFPPLGVVLVALLGVGVAEHTGFISAALRSLLSVTHKRLLTPMVILVGVASSYAADAGYVLVTPLGGVVFYAAGRHPLAGIAAAFAGVSGGYSANFVIPGALEPLLQGFTQSAAHLLDPAVNVSVLCNNIFTGVSSLLVLAIAWPLTDRLIEPRLARVAAIDGDPQTMPRFEPVTELERRGLIAGLIAAAAGAALFTLWLLPADSALRLDGRLSDFQAPIMKSIVPLIFLLFLIPGVVYGYVAGTVKSHRDIIEGMTQAMNSMAYYLVLAFFCAQFIWLFGESNLGVLLSIKGADLLRALALPGPLTLCGVILMVGLVNLFIGSASAKWGLIAPVLVPMLMQLGISPDLTQAAFRVGDSATNIITPLMPYFPLVVVFCRRYTRGAGIGTVVSMMLPYSLTLLAGWSLLLALFWILQIPLGLASTYTYP